MDTSISVKKSDEIEKRILEIKSAYSPEDIHFELLRRNKNFLADWKATFPLKMKRGILQMERAVWGSELERVCRRWGLSPRSMGCPIDRLHYYIDLSPDLIFRDHSGRTVMKSLRANLSDPVKWEGHSWPEYNAFEGPCIYIRINRWSRFSGAKIKQEVDGIQRKIWRAMPKAPKTFGRDLCWWDLNHLDYLGRRSAGQIRDLWKKYKKQELSINTIKAALFDMQKKIKDL